MSMSREVKLKLRSGLVVKAKRVPPEVHDQYCDCGWGTILLKPGDWIVELPSGKMPMKDREIRAIFEPAAETLLKRWNNA